MNLCHKNLMKSYILLYNESTIEQGKLDLEGFQNGE